MTEINELLIQRYLHEAKITNWIVDFNGKRSTDLKHYNTDGTVYHSSENVYKTQELKYIINALGVCKKLYNKDVVVISIINVNHVENECTISSYFTDLARPVRKGDEQCLIA